MLKQQRFYSNGKLLLSGEYLVLKGAEALALPVKFGQEMTVSAHESDNGMLKWEARSRGETWFEAELDIQSLAVIETSDIQKAGFLKKLLETAAKLNPKTLSSLKDISVVTDTNFDINWGLGSSSTLITNLAGWFGIDPFNLHDLTSSGSGYDIACASASGPVFYSLTGGKPHISQAAFHPDFKHQLFFVYLGKKQHSHQSIRKFADRLQNREPEISRVSEISRELVATHDLEEFEYFIDELEGIMSGVLDIPTIKDTTFAGLPGSVKSLGAWGGDFVMMTWRDGIQSLKDYLAGIGLKVVFAFDDIIRQRKTEKVH